MELTKFGAMEFRQLLIQIAVVGVFVSSFSNLSEVWAQTTGFLYIDCGATTSQLDPVTGITWLPDAAYISTGVPFAKVPNALDHTKFVEVGTLRYFNNGRTKNCYTLPVTKNETYLLRLSFYHGSYDGATSVSFEVGVDASNPITVTISDTSVHHVREFTIQPQRNVTFVCLIPSTLSDNPFISGISLRPVSVLPTRIKTLLAENELIFTPYRIYFAGPSADIVRYPDDVHDRLWLPYTKNSSLVSATAPIEDLAASGSVYRGEIPSYLDPPHAALKTAITTSGNLTISLPTNEYIASAYLAIYFLELDPTANTTDRQFNIHVPDPTYDDRYENPLNFSGAFRGDYWVWSRMTYPTDFSVVMYPNPNRTSLRGPIINSLELSHSLGKLALPTNIRDVLAIEAIKSHLNLTGWSGDPCLPYPYPWLNCTNTTPGEFDIVAVYLSGYNLTGTIPAAFGELSKLTTLALDDNYLVGVIPDLRSLRNLQTLHLQNNTLTGNLPTWLASIPSLRELYVQNNNFSGPIPEGLNSSNNLDFRFEGNPWLGKDISPSIVATSATKSKVGTIIGAVVGAIVAIGVILIGIFVYFRFFRKHTQKETPQPPNDLRGPSLRGARSFTYQEIVNATSNFKHEIGKGGFGSVYYGKLPDGQEIAVKVLDKTSVQGSSEFLNEVEILSRVHHKNVVAMVGYCEAKENPMLVYEFVHNGSLRDHLSGTNSFRSPEKLDWKSRVSIALNAAQGLEYLHTSCNPSFIHRDVKSSNVLLTTKFEAKIADFGMSRLVKEQEPTQVITQVKGTPGYLDPEYFNTNKLSPKTDVFSFGVVLLELITGRLPLDTSRQDQGANLCDWVRHALEAGNIDVILDPAVRASKPTLDALWKVAEIAMKCVEPKSVHRPKMSVVVQELQGALNMVSPSVFNSSHYSDYSPSLQHMPVTIPVAR